MKQPKSVMQIGDEPRAISRACRLSFFLPVDWRQCKLSVVSASSPVAVLSARFVGALHRCFLRVKRQAVPFCSTGVAYIAVLASHRGLSRPCNIRTDEGHCRQHQMNRCKRYRPPHGALLGASGARASSESRMLGQTSVSPLDTRPCLRMTASEVTLVVRAL